jgi:hypothetical protein
LIPRLLGLASVAVAGAVLALVVPAVARADAFVPPALLGKAKADASWARAPWANATWADASWATAS